VEFIKQLIADQHFENIEAHPGYAAQMQRRDEFRKVFFSKPCRINVTPEGW
jgi:hypothetical protein